MNHRSRSLAIVTWWPALAVACYALATISGPIVDTVPQPVRDGSSLCLLLFIPGASWTTTWGDRSIGPRILAAVIVLIVAALLVVVVVVMVGSGLRRELLFGGLIGITLFGSVASIVRRGPGGVDDSSVSGDIVGGLTGLAVFIMMASAAGP